MKQKVVYALIRLVLAGLFLVGVFSSSICVGQVDSVPQVGPAPYAMQNTSVSPKRLVPASPGTTRLPNEELIAASAIDASLHSIAIVSEDRLCAVGDRGAILLTNDAGHSWDLLPSPTSCNLYAVAFEGELGFAVGGWIGNVTNTSHGVVLRSTDGGKTWETTAALQLSRLTGLRLIGGRLIAWGDYSPELSSSVFESSDGGLSWHAIPAEIGHAAAVGVSPSGAIAAVDSLGRASFTQSPMVKNIPTTSRIKGLHQTALQFWLACGDNGECIASGDGREWHEVPLPLSPEARAVVNFATIAAVPRFAGSEPFNDRLHEQTNEQELWMGGSPGSLLLHSKDSGVSWQVAMTGHFLPIEDLAFLDSKRGWAVGAQGQILATRDGGDSWYAQRSQADRIGVLAAVSRPSEIPWCPLAACAWDEQVGSVAIVTNDDEPIDRANFLANSSTQLAALAPQVGMVGVSCWNATAESKARREQRLALELLAWRPDVVLSNEAMSLDPYAVFPYAVQGSEVSVAAAIALAADAQNAMPIAAELGLSSWQVSKFASVTSDHGGQYSEQSRRVLRSPGLAIWDILLPLPPDVRVRSESVAMRTIWARSQAEVVHTSLFGGCAKSTENGRRLSVGNHGNYQLVMGRVHRQNSLRGLADQPLSESLDKWTTELNFVLSTFPASEAGPALVELSKQLAQTANWERQRTVLETLAVRGAGSDEADWAKLSLLKRTSSDEFAAWKSSTSRKSEDNQQNVLGNLAIGFETQPQLNQATWNASPFESEQDMRSGVVTASAVAEATPSTLGPSLNFSDWLTLMNRACQLSPKLRSRTDVKALLAKQMRVSGDTLNQTEVLQTLGESTELIGWNQIAQQELSIAAHRQERLKWRASAVKADLPPLLDGQLDEEFWRRAKAIQLSCLENVSASQISEVFWAYDETFLYIGIECSRDPALPVVPVADVREYDAALEDLDQIQILLDTDRDYNTAVELAVAENGQTYDRCCGIRSYNPKWHVFVKPEQDRWTAEVAIRFSELTTAEFLSNETWALSVRRLCPGREPQSWSQLRTHRPLLHGAGILHFSTGE